MILCGDVKLSLVAAGSCEPGQALTGAALSIRLWVRQGVASRLFGGSPLPAGSR